MNYTTQKQSAIERLKYLMTGDIVQPGSANYERFRKIWSGAITDQPAAIALPETAEDVQTAVKWAGYHRIPLSVLGGGHDWAGRGLNDGGLVLNLQKLKSIEIDPAERTAVVGGGITGRELIAAADPFGLVAVTGSCGSVGLAGWALGGGYGLLSSSYGLGVDNLLSADLVLADGSLVKANENENPDLFWAIRGGGGNFGVVTSMTIRLHPAKPLLAGMILFAWSEAETVLKGYAALMEAAPDQLSMLAGLIPGPDGIPLFFLVPAWNGDIATGEKYIAALKQLGTPVMEQVSQMKYFELLGMFDPHIVNGRHYDIQTRWLPRLDSDSISAIVKAGANRSSPLTLLNMHPFHGAPTRVPLSDTAFGLRAPHFLVEIITTWEPMDGANSATHRRWASDLSENLAKNALPGGYPNFLVPDQHSQIARAYGDNLSRLQNVKKAYDKENFFKAIPIPR